MISGGYAITLATVGLNPPMSEENRAKPGESQRMEERPVFVNQDVPLESRDWLFGFDEFLGRAAQFANELLAALREPDSSLDPVLVIGNQGDLVATTWTVVSREYQEHFLDRVVPETLASYECSMVALLATSRLNPGEDEAVDEAQELVLLYALDGSRGDSLQAAAFAAAIHRTPDSSPRLGMFLPVDDGMPPAVAEALADGLDLANERDLDGRAS